MPNFLHPEFDGHRTGALMTTRTGGYSVEPCFGGDGTAGGGMNLGMHSGDEPSLVLANRNLLAERAGRPVQWLSQVHGSQVVNIRELHSHEPEADGAVTASARVALAVLAADCLPVLFSADGLVGAAHAGWRGLAAGVLENTVDLMVAEGARVDQIRAWIGPGIGPGAFEVGNDVYAEFCHGQAADTKHFQPQPDKGSAQRWLADLPGLARARLLRCGVEHVTGSDQCTTTESQYFSYRRDGRCGRMAAVVWLNA